MRKNLKKTVKIPAGIDNGQSLCLRGMGNAGHRGGPNGDLYVSITVRPHRQFTRKGFDLYIEMPISYTTAALGGSVTVPTLKESVKYTIPAGTQTGATYRLRDQGVQRLNANGKGDLIVTVHIDVPKHLTEEQRSLLEKLAATMGEGAETRNGKKSSSKGR
ncbi:Chaperone protein DnaJ [bioreactor metagenome]|uniref:Chaperone protein DnaJ n=1 Tax=bioreactor metagenome TaxID=1076179 RepID=A0A645BVL4_9ZZZZ